MNCEGYRCWVCGETKWPNNFYWWQGRRRNSKCKDCDLKASRAWKRKHPKQNSAHSRKWNKANPEKVLAWRTKNAQKLKERLRMDKQKHPGKWKLKNLQKRLRKEYDFSLAEYQSMVSSQSNRCAMCKQKPGEGQRLDIDHNHKTNKVRGLLCSLCNRTVSYVENHANRLKLARKYLEKYNGSAQNRPVPTLWAPMVDEADSAALREM